MRVWFTVPLSRSMARRSAALASAANDRRAMSAEKSGWGAVCWADGRAGSRGGSRAVSCLRGSRRVGWSAVKWITAT